MKTPFYTRLPRLAIILLILNWSLLTHTQAQPLVNTTWMVTGSAQAAFKSEGIDSLKWVFLPGNQFKWTASFGDSTTYGHWWQTSNNTFTFVFSDTSANNPIFNSVCANDTFYVSYHITTDTFYFDSSTGGCAIIAAILAGSKWVDPAFLGVTTVAAGNAAISIYPVPAHNELFINTDIAFRQSRSIVVSLYNGVGQNVKELTATPGNVQITGLEQLPTGIYLLHLRSDNGQTATRRIIIQH